MNYRWGTQIQFDTLAFKLEELLQNNDLHAVRGQANISGLTLHQRRISPDTVLLDRGTIDCQVNIGKNYLELDSVSRINFNQLDFHPYLKAEKDSDWHITASVNKQDFPANDLFVSLPKGLFNNLEGLKANGTLSYHFYWMSTFPHWIACNWSHRLLPVISRSPNMGIPIYAR